MSTFPHFLSFEKKKKKLIFGETFNEAFNWLSIKTFARTWVIFMLFQLRCCQHRIVTSLPLCVHVKYTFRHPKSSVSVSRGV